ncbi:DEKNAAC102130 [Brettanomyces naardenensis]|uniref:DEKNAAC102130 n=1 Tax=Brettanomyces naardenensis TaxID=13370 RepID=A0A448YK00_BRENA|nr:DEKNAAC102130 [Brettanomyces naardenensis]
MYTVRALVDNFFDHVYYLFPYVDEDSFREDLGRLEVSSGRAIIPEGANASSIALLLLVLRFSYLGIPGFGHPGAIKNVTLRLMVASGISIGPNFVEMARNLLLSVGGVHSIFNRITLPRIQCLLYLRIYQRFSPELNEANAENSLFVCLLAQMCKLVGLNRDPDFFPELIKKDSVKSIWRKIFYKLMSLDILDAYQYGSSTMFLEGQYDTKLPRLSDSDEKALRLFSSNGILGTDSDPQRLKRLALERSINQDIELEYKLCVILRRGLQPYQEVARKMPADQLGSVLRELTDFRTEYFPKISSLMADSYVKGSIEELFQTPRTKRLEIGCILLMQIETFGYIGYLGGLDTLDGAYKATDATICLFKLSSDFASHLCGWDANEEAHGRIERYCDGLTRFLSVHVQKCFERCLFWLMSVMASELQSGEQRFEQLIGNLEDSADVAAVKQWLHDEKTSGISMEQLFERLRTYFAALTQLRDDYFICWRNRVMVKLFFIFFRRLDEARFNQFFGNDSMVKAASAGVKAVVAEGGSTPVLPSIDTLEEEINAMVDNGEYGSSIVDWLQSDNVANIFGIEFPPGNEG